MNYKLNLLFILVICLMLRIFCIEIYRIPSDSMAPTLWIGDWVLVNKWATGSRLINFNELFEHNKLSYYRLFEQSIQKNDLVVFNFPIHTTQKDATVYGQTIVKRCFAMAGDTISINRTIDDLSDISGFSLHNNTSTLLYPYDKELNWTIASYGPLWVPEKGAYILNDSISRQHLSQVLCMEEQLKASSDSNFRDNIFTKPYALQHDYYFMLGDNFYASQDSRFWGFVPDNHIIGKVELVLFSIDPYADWYKSFIWNRLLKVVE